MVFVSLIKTFEFRLKLSGSPPEEFAVHKRGWILRKTQRRLIVSNERG